MCTTVGFSCKDGVVFGRTLEAGVEFDNRIMFIPRDYELFTSGDKSYSSRYALLGTGFTDDPALGDGMNEAGLMGSSNLFPGYSTFASTTQEGKLGLTDSQAFNYLLSNCASVDEVRQKAKEMIIVEHDAKGEVTSTGMHFFFMDACGKGLVLELDVGNLVTYDNPYGVLTNAPEFPWHVTNLKNYIHLQPENIEERTFNGEVFSKFGEGSGLVGLPGDFTPPSRFIRAAYFVSNTPKDLEREKAILQTFRILSQADIPTGAVVDAQNGRNDLTLYTSVMDTKKKGYFVKCHDNINIQPYYLDDFEGQTEVKHIELEKKMTL